jgi:hypothetical protein
MAARHAPVDPALLETQVEGIRRLARALLSDVDLAEDAAPETMRLALENGPRRASSPLPGSGESSGTSCGGCAARTRGGSPASGSPPGP